MYWYFWLENFSLNRNCLRFILFELTTTRFTVFVRFCFLRADLWFSVVKLMIVLQILQSYRDDGLRNEFCWILTDTRRWMLWIKTGGKDFELNCFRQRIVMRVGWVKESFYYWEGTGNKSQSPLGFIKCPYRSQPSFYCRRFMNSNKTK